MGGTNGGRSIWDMVALEDDQEDRPADGADLTGDELADTDLLFSQLVDSSPTTNASEGTPVQEQIRMYLDNLILLGFMSHGGDGAESRSVPARFLQRNTIGERLDAARSALMRATDMVTANWASALPTYDRLINEAGPFLITQELRRIVARNEVSGVPGAADIDNARTAYAAIMFGDDLTYSTTLQRKYGPTLNMALAPMTYASSDSPLLLTFAGVDDDALGRMLNAPAFWRFYFATCHRDNLNDGCEYVGFVGGLSLPIDPMRLAMPFSHIPWPNIVAGLITVAVAGNGISHYGDMHSSADMKKLLSAQFFGGVMHYVAGDPALVCLLLRYRDGGCLDWRSSGTEPEWYSAVCKLLDVFRSNQSPSYRAGVFTLSADTGTYVSSYSRYAALEASMDLFDTPDDLFVGGSGAKQEAEAIDLMRQDKVESDAFDEVHTMHAKIAQKTAKERASGEQTGDDRAAAVIHYMERIPLSRGNEAVQETFAFRSAVAAIAENMERNPDGVDASMRDSLRIWCNRWLFLTPVSVTKKLLQKLGIKLVLA